VAERRPPVPPPAGRRTARRGCAEGGPTSAAAGGAACRAVAAPRVGGSCPGLPCWQHPRATLCPGGVGGSVGGSGSGVNGGNCYAAARGQQEEQKEEEQKRHISCTSHQNNSRSRGGGFATSGASSSDCGCAPFGRYRAMALMRVPLLEYLLLSERMFEYFQFLSSSFASLFSLNHACALSDFTSV
jgi:hypothetical protein